VKRHHFQTTPQKNINNNNSKTGILHFIASLRTAYQASG
jgi:hypothetical protein